MWIKPALSILVSLVIIILAGSRRPKWLKSTSFWKKYMKGNVVIGFPSFMIAICILITAPYPAAFSINIVGCLLVAMGALWILVVIPCVRFKASPNHKKSYLLGGLLLITIGVIAVIATNSLASQESSKMPSLYIPAPGVWIYKLRSFPST